MLLLALGTTFFFEGVAEPGDLQRAIGTVLIGATLMLALYAAEMPSRRLRISGALVLTLVAGVVIASAVGTGATVDGIAAIANGLLVALAPPAVVIGVLRNLRTLCGGEAPVEERTPPSADGVLRRRPQLAAEVSRVGHSPAAGT